MIGNLLSRLPQRATPTVFYPKPMLFTQLPRCSVQFAVTMASYIHMLTMTLMMTIWNHPPLPNQFISFSLLDYFRCHTYDFGATGPGICRLSHHSSATLRHVEDPYLVARGAHSYEMGACFNVTIECQANYMVANVAANRMFDGKVRGRARLQSSLNFANSSADNVKETEVLI